MSGNEWQWQWKETAWTLEEPKGALYCVAFNNFYQHNGKIFASAGCNRATVYRCPPEGGLEVLNVFVDKDPDEEYFVCKWSIDMENGNPLLLLGGKNRLLQVIDCVSGKLHTTFEGHGDHINDIAVNPTRPWLAATASKDQAVRLWNLKTRVCVLIFQGDGAHRNDVLTLDWAPGGKDHLLSAGKDSCIKIWSLEGFQDVVTASDEWKPTTKAFPTRQVSFPMFSTRGVHWNYVDCARFLGDFVLSKSVNNKIVCWKRTPEVAKRPGVEPLRNPEGAVALVQELQLEHTQDVWWLRFALNKTCTILAVGTKFGRVLVFDPHRAQSQCMTRLKPRRANGTNDLKLLVRQTAVSDDGSIIVSAHDDGSLTRYDRAGTRAEPLASHTEHTTSRQDTSKQQQQQNNEQRSIEPTEAISPIRRNQGPSGVTPPPEDPEPIDKPIDKEEEDLDAIQAGEPRDATPIPAAPPTAPPRVLSAAERELALEWMASGKTIPQSIRKALEVEEQQRLEQEKGEEKEEKSRGKKSRSPVKNS